MIVYRQPDVFDVLFALNGSILPKIAWKLLGMAGLSVAVVLWANSHPGVFARVSATPFTLIGIALSVFLSFRNSACYARWWEGRQLWGELIIACRSFARESANFDEAERNWLLRALCGFAAGLVARLRGGDEAAAIAPWIDIDNDARGPNPTNAVLHRVGARLLAMMQAGQLGQIHYSVLEKQLTAMAHVQAGCERIQTTPLPFAYALLLHRTALAFCIALPFALAGSLGWWTLLPVLLVAYTFFGLDALGHELEDPFSLHPNALPLSSLQRVIERDMLAALGERDLPPMLEPVRRVLQ